MASKRKQSKLQDEFDRQKAVTAKYNDIRSKRKKAIKDELKASRQKAWLTKAANKLSNQQRNEKNPYELLFKDELIRLGLKFIYQYPVVIHPSNYYSLDFYFPDFNIGIELDGYHHMTTKAKEHDKKRSELVFKHKGIKIYRANNSELKDMQTLIDKMMYNWMSGIK